jgi:hypothetical protein
VGAGCAVLATLVLAAKAGEVEVGALAEVEGLIGVAGVPFFFLPFLATVTQVFPKGFGALRAGKSSGEGAGISESGSTVGIVEGAGWAWSFSIAMGGSKKWTRGLRFYARKRRR